MFRPRLDILPIQGRLGLPVYLNTVGLKGIAVEVGTHRGAYAFDFLSRWLGTKLYCVDIWQPYDDGDPASLGNREDDYQFCLTRLSPFINRGICVVHRKDSKESSKLFQDNLLGFAYIDACHRYDAVLSDLRTWWPKVKPGGIIAGHDFICVNEHEGGWGKFVQPAVFDFAAEVEHNIGLIVEPSSTAWSFAIHKVSQ